MSPASWPISWSKRSFRAPEIDAHDFWGGFSIIVHELGPRNRALLKRRDDLQEKIDAWYRENGAPSDMEAYKSFLSKIGYLAPEGVSFKVTTENVDPEIATIAGPQLVVPVMNARYALNAANARWGSLYDALYGTDAIPETDGAEKGKGYNPIRGAKVIAWARDFLDEAVPLDGASWKHARGFSIADAKLAVALDGGKSDRAEAARKIRRLSWRGICAQSVPAQEQRHPYRGADRRNVDHRQERPGAYLRRVAGIGASRRSRISRIRSPRSMPRTRSRPTATGSA